MNKNSNNNNSPTFQYGSIAHASLLALAALAVSTQAQATAPGNCAQVVSATDVSVSTNIACVTIIDPSPTTTPGNLTITGTGSISGGVSTGNNTSTGSSFIGVGTASGGSITVLSGGIINNSNGPAINLGRSAGYGSGTTVSPTTTTALSGSISNAGTITGFDYGIASTITGTGVVGGIVNTGTISTSVTTIAGGSAGIYIATGSSISGGITNSGLINSSPVTGNGTAIYVEGSLGGGLTNNASGTLSGTSGLIIKGGTLSGGISNSGTIAATGEVISLSSGGRLIGDLNNSGRIQTSSTNNAVSVGSGTTITGSIINSGRISLIGGSEAGYGLRIDGRVTGSITNSGTITGMYLAPSASITGTITNTGTITSNGTNSLNLQNSDSSPVTFNNTGGTIQGGTANLGSANTFNMNSGLITSSISATAGSTIGGTTTLNIAGSLTTVSGSVASTSQITGPINLRIGRNTVININGRFVAENTISSDRMNINSGGELFLGYRNGTVLNTGTISGALDIASGGALSVVNNSTVGFNPGGSLNNSGALNIGPGATLTVSGGGYTQASGGQLQVGVASNSSYGKLYVNSGTVSMPSAPKIDVAVDTGASLTVGGLLSDVIRGFTITGGAASSYVITDNSTTYDFVAESCAGEGLGCTPGSIGLRIKSGGVLGRTPGTTPLVTTGVSGTIFQMLRMGNNVVQAVSSSNSSGGGINTGDVLGDRHGWIKPLVMRSKQNDEGTVSGYKADSSGIIGGMDGTYNEKTRLGGAISYMSSKVESNRSLGTTHDADISSWRVIGYGSYAMSANTEATFQGDYSTGTIKGRRQIAVGDVASSNYKNSTWHFSGAVSRVMDLTPGKTTFTPTLRVDYTHSRDAGYTETGSSSNLVVQSNISKEMIVAAQGKVNHAISSNTTLSVNASIGYDVIGQQSSLTAAVLGGGTTFVSTGMAPQRDVYQLGLGSLTKLAEGGEVNLRYDLETRRGFTGQSISVKYRKPF